MHTIITTTVKVAEKKITNKMNILKTLFALTLLSASQVFAEAKPYDEWEQQDKVQLATYTALAIMDYQQTSWAMKQKDAQGNYIYSEQNPLLGERPSDTRLAVAQLLTVGAMYYDIKYYDDEHRKFRWVMIAIKVAAVVHNNNVGLTFNKVW